MSNKSGISKASKKAFQDYEKLRKKKAKRKDNKKPAD